MTSRPPRTLYALITAAGAIWYFARSLAEARAWRDDVPGLRIAKYTAAGVVR